MNLSPLAQRLFDLITGTANDPTYWPDVSQLSTGLGARGRAGDGSPISAQYVVDEQRLAAAARELVESLLRAERRPDESFSVLLVAAGLAGMDAEARARLAEGRGPIAVAELEMWFGWDVERRALFVEAWRERPDNAAPLPSMSEWLSVQPGCMDFARTALEAAAARVAAIHAGEIPYRAEKAFEERERWTLSRAVELALLRDEPWLPELLDRLLPGIAVAPTPAKSLPSQALLFSIARQVESHPTPEAISALRAARQAVRHAGVPKHLDRMFKRIEAALANRLEVAFRIPDGRLRQAVGEHTAVISTDGGVELSWWHRDKKLKGVPAAVRREHPEEVKRLRELAKQTARQQATLVRALEAGCAGETAPPYRRLEGHPVTDRLIWEFEVSPGVWRAELGLSVPDVPVRLWHPARASVEEVRAWREVVQGKELRQPYKQAFREVYLLTPAEEETRDHSRRFSNHLLRYGQAKALLTDRGWTGMTLGHWTGMTLGHWDAAGGSGECTAAKKTARRPDRHLGLPPGRGGRRAGQRRSGLHLRQRRHPFPRRRLAGPAGRCSSAHPVGGAARRRPGRRRHLHRPGPGRPRGLLAVLRLRRPGRERQGPARRAVPIDRAYGHRRPVHPDRSFPGGSG
ncbi:DUF4132 domain-containing protein [Streptosporangium lutulentum]|uniref:DUF4132 domain-containing protein n=1 Tax=Streptosporangium lutulentum TaxID=1461250 RepID=A0ABT9QFL8_9ACTN|nr:DUF4132 domain-containing protein [Streptosporangium lutulentum]MDP9845536.1 hypothetical protein [Streptosporangium lutulentum]